MKINKKILTIIFWLLFITWIITSIYLYLNWVKIDDILSFVWDNIYLIVWFSLLVFSLRIFLFIPSTLIIIWLWVLTQDFLLTFVVSFLWIFIGLLETYFIWYLVEEDLDWSNLIKKVKPHIEKIRENGFVYVFLWCFTPILPTDIICYSAWFVRYNLWKFLLAWMLWELPLILIYSYLWWEADKIIRDYSFVFVILLFIIVLYFIYSFMKNKKKKKSI